MSQPFSRSIAIAAAVAHAMSLVGHERDFALAGIGDYESRGKGQGKFSGLAINTRQTTFKNLKVGGGNREVARRKRQIKSGMLQIS